MTVVEIVLLVIAIVTPLTILGLTIWATKTGRLTASKTITHYGKIHNWYLFLWGILVGHWTIDFIPNALHVWPYCAALLVGVALKDLIRAVMKFPITWLNNPFIWFALGLMSGAAFWSAA